MTTMLEREAPDVARRIRDLGPEQRRAIIAVACVAVAASLTNCEDSTRRLIERLAGDATLSAQDLRAAKDLAERADNDYLEMHPRGNDEAVLARFREARLLTAIATAFGESSTSDSEEAVYELSKACDDPSPVFDIILGVAK